MAQAHILPKPAPAWFYALVEWICNFSFTRPKKEEENYFLIH
jgi:hypothetical protein